MKHEVVLDETRSFAHREGDQIRLSLRVRGAVLQAAPAVVQLRAGKTRVRVPAEVTSDEQGATVAFSAPEARLRRRVWSMAIQSQTGDDSVPVQARLLARRTQPVALLPGPTPTTRLAPPTPRGGRSLAVRAGRRLPDPIQSLLRRTRATLRRRRG